MSEKETPFKRGDTEPDAPPQREETPPPSKNKPSSVYIYLAVMFGAAFLMLLLAYFVQRRSNDDVRDDLRLATASRQELMEQIQTLEGENQTLTEGQRALREEAERLQQAYDQEWSANQERQARLTNQLVNWNLFWAMDSAFRAGNYESCAGFFKEEFTSQTYATPGPAEERTEEIYQALIAAGVLTQDTPLPTVSRETSTD